VSARKLAAPPSVAIWPKELMDELRAVGTICMAFDMLEDYTVKIDVLRAALILSGLNIDVVKR
jgi:hypothetical protein